MRIDDPGRFDASRSLASTSTGGAIPAAGDKYVTVIIDWTSVREGTGPARLLDMVEGRSKTIVQAVAFAEPAPVMARGLEVVAMDGFTGFKTAAAEELPDAAVMDPSTWCACRQRVR